MHAVRSTIGHIAAALALTLAAGATASAVAGTPPARQGDVFVFSDGTRVRAVDPGGHAGTVQRDGSIRYSDGTSVSHDAKSGETRIDHPDGRSDVSGGRMPSRGADGNFQYSDGTSIRGTDPSGNPGKINPDGSISYSDGTHASHDTRTGDTKFVGPDGSVRLMNPRTGTDKSTPGASGGQRSSGDTSKAAPARSNQNTSASNDNKNDKGQKQDKEKADKGSAEKPAKEPKEKTDKGRTVQDDQPSTTGSGQRVTVGGLTQNKTGDEAPTGGGQTKLKRGSGVGPGARGPGSDVMPAGTILTLPAGSLVVNPDPTKSVGGGSRTPVDPYGGRR